MRQRKYSFSSMALILKEAFALVGFTGIAFLTAMFEIDRLILVLLLALEAACAIFLLTVLLPARHLRLSLVTDHWGITFSSGWFFEKQQVTYLPCIVYLSVFQVPLTDFCFFTLHTTGASITVPFLKTQEALELMEQFRLQKQEGGRTEP